MADQNLKETVLDMWAGGKSKREICEAIDIHPNTVKMINWRARKEGDPRAYAKTRPLMQASCDSVLELQKEQWFIKGLAEKLNVHFTQVESAVRNTVIEVQEKGKPK